MNSTITKKDVLTCAQIIRKMCAVGRGVSAEKLKSLAALFERLTVENAPEPDISTILACANLIQFVASVGGVIIPEEYETVYDTYTHLTGVLDAEEAKRRGQELSPVTETIKEETKAELNDKQEEESKDGTVDSR